MPEQTARTILVSSRESSATKRLKCQSSRGQKLGSYTTISVKTLPESQNERLGGRQSSSLN